VKPRTGVTEKRTEKLYKVTARRKKNCISINLLSTWIVNRIFSRIVKNISLKKCCSNFLEDGGNRLPETSLHL